MGDARLGGAGYIKCDNYSSVDPKFLNALFEFQTLKGFSQSDAESLGDFRYDRSGPF
jgi:hypothetical protein